MLMSETRCKTSLTREDLPADQLGILTTEPVYVNCIVCRFVYRSRNRKLLNTLCVHVYLSILQYYPTGSVETSKHFYLFAESADVLLDYNTSVTDNRFQ